MLTPLEMLFIGWALGVLQGWVFWRQREWQRERRTRGRTSPPPAKPDQPETVITGSGNIRAALHGYEKHGGTMPRMPRP